MNPDIARLLLVVAVVADLVLRLFHLLPGRKSVIW